MKTAIISGTFDPVTVGHTDVIRKAASLFELVYVCVLNNGEKHTMFTEEQRFAIMKAAVEGLEREGISNVRTDLYSGLTSDYMREHGITYIVKGVRNSSDFDYEYGMARIMKSFLPEAETVLVPAEPEHMHISSTYVREIIKYGGPLEAAVPEGTAELIRRIRGDAAK